MPYIKQTDRNKLAYQDYQNPETSGELNYLITRLLHQYVKNHGLCYNTLNEVLGVMTCAGAEFYRTIVAPYEEEKIEENGDV